MRSLLKKFAALVSLTLIMSSYSYAQLEEIVVLATKRAESIQDVPVSVSVMSYEQMQTFVVKDMEDLSSYIPNFEINSVAVVPNLYMRGIGGGLTHSIEQSVGRFIDDVYISRGVINLHGFMDLANAEVLRGPQGTLFGKNTVGGALILRTGDPTNTFESGLNVGVSDFKTVGGTKDVEGFISGPLSETLAGRVAVRFSERTGPYENRLDGPNGTDRSDRGIRGKLAWTPNDRFSADLKLEYMNYDEYGSDAAEWSGAGGPPLFVYQRHSPEFTPELDWMVDYSCNDVIANRDTTGDGMADTAVNTGSFCPQRDQTSTNATLKLEYEVDSGVFTSISALQDYTYDYQFYGLDMGLANAFRATRNEDYNGFSQEFRFTSNEGDDFDYIVGAYLEDSDLSRFQSSDFNLVTVFFDPSGLFIQRNEPWNQNTKTLAAFGQLRWHLSESVSMTFGGRWATEEKDFAFERFFDEYGTDNRLNIPGGPGGPPLSVAANRSEDKFTGMVSAQWYASDDVMTYASFSQGHKTGGFSDRIESPTQDFEFDAENVDAWELGAKMSLLDGAMTLNMALFYMAIEDMQLSTQLPGAIPAFSVDNAADSTSKGLEIEAVWSVNDVFSLGANYAYTDASYDSFPGSENCPEGVTPAPDGSCDLAGFPLIFAPDNKGTLYGDLYFDDMMGEWDLAVHADMNYTDQAYTDIAYRDPSISRKRTIYNANLKFVSPTGQYSVTLFGKNLSNEAYCAWCVPSGPNFIATMGNPREIGLQFSARFD